MTQYDCVEYRRMIGRFKQFAEHCSERYHTTLLMSTNYHLEDFEPASIGSQRFETLVKLKEGIKQKKAAFSGGDFINLRLKVLSRTYRRTPRPRRDPRRRKDIFLRERRRIFCRRRCLCR